VKTVLFLCTANYYRSRFAEHYFNWHAQRDRLPWRADSCGLEVGKYDNPGPIARHTLKRLEMLGIPANGSYRDPRQATEEHLSAADLTIAVKEAEHRAMMDEILPAWSDCIEYWHIDDLDCAEPEEALPLLEEEIRSLLARLSCNTPKKSFAR
jgi:protein-tyrosine phosphatase